VTWHRPALVAAILLVAVVSSSSQLGAQQPTARPDSTRPARVDSAGPGPARQDTTGRAAAHDTLPGWPYLSRGVLPTVQAEAPPGPLPPGTRYVFTRDSITWSTAQTLADLLTAIPGVYVARGGFLGLPEYVMYGGRGAAALQVLWDGMPLLPLGPDSVYVDPARIPLTYLRRVDVEVLPATLRVYLVSERNESLAPRSLVRVLSGAFHAASYAGIFQNRWPSGLGLDLAGNFVGGNGSNQNNYHIGAFDVWAKATWLPTASTSVSYQIRRQQYDHDSVPAGAGAATAVGIPAVHGARTDAIFAMSVSQRPFAMGWHATAGFGTSSWSNDSVIGDRGVHQAFASVGYQAPRWQAEASGTLADVRTTRALTTRVSWTPLPALVLAGDATLARLQGGRSSRAADASAALLVGPLSLVGEISTADAVQAPALLADTTQRTVDRAVRLRLNTAPLGGDIGLVRRAAYQPLPLGELPVIPSLAGTQAATYLVVDARLQPINALSLHGWYESPRTPGNQVAADFEPPSHVRADVTFRSKFWRTFRSGAFDCQIQLAMESWGAGTAGLDANGSPITLPGVTYYETSLSFQIVGFTAFWDMRDARNTRKQYVPGLPYPSIAQVFGVRWVFTN
jgi:hypothetical protein